MKKLLFVLGCLLALLLPLSAHFQRAHAASPPQPKVTYQKAQVVSVISEGEKEVVKGRKNNYQRLKLRVIDGEEKNTEVTVDYGGTFTLTSSQALTQGDIVVLAKTLPQNGKVVYAVMDKYRLDTVLYILFWFFLFVILVAGKRGFGSLIGMLLSLGIIMLFIIPSILQGSDPLFISIVGASVIMVSTIYIAHGFSKKTTVAVVATGISLLLTGFLSLFFVTIAKLSGMGSEDAYMLQLGTHSLRMQGILLGGMIIGTLGVLDDVTTTQAATVFAIANENKKLSMWELFAKAYAVGKDHIASLVNTLVLAYAGASLSLFLLFVLNPTKQPTWVILNSEIIMQEVIRTLAGSSGLILAVPITTILASWIATRKIKPQQ